jgi:hypothetical protein
MADKAEKHRLAVKKYRESLGIDKVRELTRGYTENKRKDLEYKNQEKEKNKLRAQQKREQINIEKLNDKIDATAIADKFIEELVHNTINLLPIKRGRGRPRMTEEQKAEAKKNRDAAKLS